MYIITQNLLLPDKEMPPNPVQAVCVAWSSSFLISSSVVPTINASCAPHLCPFVQFSCGRGGWPYFIQLIIPNHPNVSLCLLYVFLVSILLSCLFLSNNVYMLTKLHFKIAVLTAEEIKKDELWATHTVRTGFGGIFLSGNNRFCVIIYIFH